MREICSRQLEDHPFELGGPGKTVQIDESLFRHKPKYHRERHPRADAWVFGMVDTSTQPAIGYMELVPDRSAATLLPIIRRHVLPGTTIRSDMWRAYNGISQMGYNHETVNHSQHFVYPITGTHTQNIESYWAQTKLKFKAMKGITSSKQLSSHLDEKMWRDLYRINSYTTIINHMNNIYYFN